MRRYWINNDYYDNLTRQSFVGMAATSVNIRKLKETIEDVTISKLPPDNADSEQEKLNAIANSDDL